MSALTVFPAPVATSGCVNRQVDCSDSNSVLLFTLLALANSNGSTPSEIASQIPIICPTVAWTASELDTYILVAFRRGVITTVEPGTYAVNAAMARVNPSNRNYYCICQLYRS